MVDQPYAYPIDNDVNVLDGKLENELQKLGWRGEVGSSIRPVEAYNFIVNLVKSPSGLAKIKNSVFGHLLTKAVKAVDGVDPFT